MAEPGRRCAKCGDSFGPEVLYCPRDGQPLTSRRTELADDPYLGLVVDGLRLDQLVGLGAMGRVYRAREAGIDRDVAVKILHRELLRNPLLVTRFEREARVAGRLSHPNVISVFRSGVVAEGGPNTGGEAYMVLEYLDGISLRSALAAAGGALPLPRALHIVLQICDAVGDAHGRGVVHRDLKPDNLMLVRRGDDPDFVKVLDFGVARFAEGDHELFTQAGAVLGTARYISPEGARGEPVGAPGDVYSITIMLFECLAGATPFDGESPVAILVKQTSDPAPDVRSIPRGSYVPEPIARLVARNLDKDSAVRARDARELGRALVAAALESGLAPEDLLPRSTLLGTRPVLRLPSLERTKALRFDAAPAAGPRGTHLVDPPEGATLAPLDPRAASPPSPSQPPLEPPPALVDPTLTETPPPLQPRPSTSGASRPSTSGASRPSTSGASRPSTSGARLKASAPPPAMTERAPLRKAALIAACFLGGGAVALLAATSLGAFEVPGPTPESYVSRARSALSRGAILTPPGENVRDLTRTALGVWPGHQELAAVRRDAARELVAEARRRENERPAEALSLVQAAVELDPASRAAHDYLATLTRRTREPPPPPSASTPVPVPVARKPARVKASPPPAAKPSVQAREALPDAPPRSDPPNVASPPPAARPGAEPGPGGRWL